MDSQELLKDFRKKVCESVDLVQEGVDRFIVKTPFTFEDGDALKVVVARDADGWYLSDEGHTFMHLSYDEIDIEAKTRRRLLDQVLATYRVENRDGELRAQLMEDQMGDSLFSFLQALTKISDLTYMTREHVRSLFFEEFRTFIGQVVPEEDIVFDYIDDIHDPKGDYPIDVMIRTGTRPLFVFAMRNDNQVRDATIKLLYFENKEVDFKGVGVFERQEDINRKVLAWFTNVCERQFSSLQGMKERFPALVASGG
jgi:hypothetical protein